jgi:hypothetical protein
MATTHLLDDSQPPVNLGGRPRALKPEHIVVLHDIVTERAQASLQEIADELHRRCGVRVLARGISASSLRLDTRRSGCAAPSPACSQMCAHAVEVFDEVFGVLPQIFLPGH